jgi:hypothetical protein
LDPRAAFAGISRTFREVHGSCAKEAGLFKKPSKTVALPLCCGQEGYDQKVFCSADP